MIIPLVLYPLSVIKLNFSTDTEGKFENIKDCVKKTYKSGGFTGFFTGIGVFMASSIGHRAVLSNTYSLIRGVSAVSRSEALKYFLCSGIAILTGLLFYPLETIRHRMIVDKTKETPEFTGALSCIKRIGKKEGFRGFYKGVSAKIINGVVPTVVTPFIIRAIQNIAKN